jgi:hypothetical protein
VVSPPQQGNSRLIDDCIEPGPRDSAPKRHTGSVFEDQEIDSRFGYASIAVRI